MGDGAVRPPLPPSGIDARRAPVLGQESRPTARELEVLRLVAEGLPDREIAARLGLATRTVHRRVASILGKPGSASRAAAVRRAARDGLT